MTYTSETICAISGAALVNLKRWYRSGVIQKYPSGREWTEAQLQEVMDITRLTSQGATIREIKTAQAGAHPLRTGGWAARRGDMLWQLEFGSPQSLRVLLRKLASNFTGDDFVLRLLLPLHQWLRDDRRAGASRRMERFHQLMVAHAGSVTRHATPRAPPLFHCCWKMSARNTRPISGWRRSGSAVRASASKCAPFAPFIPQSTCISTIFTGAAPA